LFPETMPAPTMPVRRVMSDGVTPESGLGVVARGEQV